MAQKYQREDLKKIYLIKCEYEKSHGSSTEFKTALSRFNNCLTNNNFSENDIEDLLKTIDIGIASIKQGNDEYQQVRQNRNSIYKTIKELKKFDFEQEHPEKLLVDKYQELLDVVSQECKRKKRIITNRLLAIFFYKYLTATCSDNAFKTIADFMYKNFENYPKPSRNWLLDNFNFVKYCRESFEEDFDSLPIAASWGLYLDIKNGEINKLLEDKTMAKTENSTLAQECAELLKNTKNIILHGAPGTGKTYLARKIAEEMNAEVGFVQFHPSYDYTDFVEGIRPTTDGKFNLEDGIFKKFCEKALQNYLDSKKDNQILQKENDIKDLFSILYDKIANGETTEIELREGVMDIVGINGKGTAIYLKTKNSNSELKYTISLNRLTKLAEHFKNLKELEEIKNIYEDVTNAIKGCHSSAYWGVLKTIYTIEEKEKSLKFNEKTENKIKEEKFVFIIDEINRGELSKIFGELFFAIDPGYRGEKGKILTQYANMATDPNEFDEVLESEDFGHFFVPENVYIIGTMNDIDRSVESMDLAMRRRFTFKEIKAEDNLGMLDQISDEETKKKAKEKMKALNEAIKKTEGLSDAYQIGGAYFAKLKDLNNNFDLLWEYNLEPLLREYLRGQGDITEKLKQLENAYKA